MLDQEEGVDDNEKFVFDDGKVGGVVGRLDGVVPLDELLVVLGRGEGAFSQSP